MFFLVLSLALLVVVMVSGVIAGLARGFVNLVSLVLDKIADYRTA